MTSRHRDYYKFPPLPTQASSSTSTISSSASRSRRTVSFASTSTVNESDTSITLCDAENGEDYYEGGSASTSHSGSSTPRPRIKKSVTFSQVDHVISFDNPRKSRSSGISSVFPSQLKRRLSFSPSPPHVTPDGSTVYSRGRDSPTAACGGDREPHGGGYIGSSPPSSSSFSSSSSTTLIDSPRSPRLQDKMGALPGEAIIFPPWPDPHPEFCNQINASVRKYLGLATFDFADHIKERPYILKSLPVSAHHSCVTLLDSGVDGLVSSMTPGQVPGYSMKAASTQRKFVIKETPAGSSMGLGMFALVNMPNNTPIDAEHPVIITPYVIGVPVPTQEIYQLIFGKLGMDVQMAFSELCGSRKDGKAKSESLYESIMKANSLPVDLPVLDPGDRRAELPCHRALFLNASRINHSCSPNALWTWDLDSFTLQLRSVRHTRASEEITVAYVPPELSFQERRDLLRERYGFECHCTHCGFLQGMKYSVEVAKSDSARLFLTQFWNDGRTKLPTFRTWCEDRSLSPDMLIEAHKQALGLIKREGLEVLNTVAPSSESSKFLRDVARHVDAVAMCYGALQDVENFRFWVKQSRGYHSFPSDVSDHGGVGNCQAVLDRWLVDPSSFPAWGWRGGVKDGIVFMTSPESLDDFIMRETL